MAAGATGTPADSAMKKTPRLFCYAECAEPVHRLTKWIERIKLQTGTKIIRHRIPGNRLYRTSCCRKRRPAKNLLVEGGGWYDPLFFCAPKKGCNKT